MKILFVGSRDPLHSKAGGYDRIAEMPDTDCLWDKQALFGFLPHHKRGKFINLFFQELKARSLGRNYDIVHYFYGDALQRPFPKDRSYKVVATVHMNLTKRKKAPALFLKTLKSLDGVVSLSSCQQKELKEKFGLNSVFIPHGFNRPTYVYHNMHVGQDKVNIVISGSNYRDTETMYVAIKFCAEQRKDIFFHLLGQPANVKENLNNATNVKCYPRLSDDDYFSVMQSCDYNFLPLTFATANNALLEAQFLGLKSILPQMSGIEDYAAPSPLNTFYSSREELFEIMKGLQKTNHSDDIIKHAEQFLWENIYSRLQSFYETIVKEKV